MASWRLARSLETLTAEIRALHPGTTVWTIGDAAHRGRPSDHNPNGQNVVCAIDVLGDKGLRLADFAADLVAAPRHPALKYVIFNRRIWSVARASEGWRPYTGSNPHTTHVHISVGTGPDGKSGGPYDNTSSWGIGGDMTGLVKGIQESLKSAGFDPGPIDDRWGPRTQSAFTAAMKAGGARGPAGPAGPAGARGPAGPAGPPGTLPARLTITGEVTATGAAP
ncbi:peptidoglycan-binding domain-containing protein [Micromonospora rosaria]|nr:peptidoglycan-binding domain-containing protein [Micromonospora rosaria]